MSLLLCDNKLNTFGFQDLNKPFEDIILGFGVIQIVHHFLIIYRQWEWKYLSVAALQYAVSCSESRICFVCFRSSKYVPRVSVCPLQATVLTFSWGIQEVYSSQISLVACAKWRSPWKLLTWPTPSSRWSRGKLSLFVCLLPSNVSVWQLVHMAVQRPVASLHSIFVSIYRFPYTYLHWRRKCGFWIKSREL